MGLDALYSNTTGNSNTADGDNALYSNTTGEENSGVGNYALHFNTTGSFNSALGQQALYANTTGSDNTAAGSFALSSNTTGSYTTAVGAYTLQENVTGGYDTGFGAYALSLNTTGSGNTAFGYAALRSTTTGNDNIGFGYQTLYQDNEGSNNIAMGYRAAYNLANGSNTIEIGNPGVAADDSVIRIGVQGTQKDTYVAGIYGATVTGSAVYLTSSGQLGVMGSSERFKTDIAAMPAVSAKLHELRPVTFHYKTDPKGVLQYGLIAEEVDKVYPELKRQWPSCSPKRNAWRCGNPPPGAPGTPNSKWHACRGHAGAPRLRTRLAPSPIAKPSRSTAMLQCHVCITESDLSVDTPRGTRQRLPRRCSHRPVRGGYK
jgi:hypothetical protein